MELMFPVSQPDVAQTLLDHAPRTRSRVAGWGSIVGPWTARSYLVRSGGAADPARTALNWRESRARPQVAADDAGEVAEPDVDILDFLVLGELEDVVGRHICH